MLRCPFCRGTNEAGAVWCEHCKRDLAAVEPGMPSTVVLKDVPKVVPLETESAPVTGEADLAAMPARTPPPRPGDQTVHDNPTITSAGSPPSPESGVLPPTLFEPKLVVVRGVKVGTPYRILPGKNYVGRRDERPVDVDLEDQEAPERVWSSRQHAVIHFESGQLTVEDLNSLNGTFVNRQRVSPGQPRPLKVGDILQIGTVQLKVTS